MDLFRNTLFFADIPPNVLAIPLTVLVLGTAVVVSGLYFQNRRRQMWHETARIALEKGQPVPPDPEALAVQKTGPENDEAADIRAGLISIATGIGLYYFLGALMGKAMGYVGAIPTFIGVALILNALITLWSKRKKNSSSAPPPQ